MSRLREQLLAERPAIGCWLSLGSPPVADVLARAGFDWLLIDGQHSPVGPAEMTAISRTVFAAGASPVIRVSSLEPATVNQALDAGAHGIMVPAVSDARQAERAVSLATYPPRGVRSIGGYGAQHHFGLSRGDYLAAGRPAMIIVQIEDARAVDMADEILGVDGIDACFVGPQDLCASLGLTPRLDSQEERYLEALDRISEAARRRRIVLGILAGDAESAAGYLRAGFRMVAVSTDARLLESAAKRVTSGIDPAAAKV